MTALSLAERAGILRTLGARPDEVEQLLAYSGSGFDPALMAEPRDYPLADEPFVEAWAEYAREASRVGVPSTLRRHLVQLRFPIEEGIHARADYRAATRRGIWPPDGRSGLAFADEEALEIVLHPTAAGRVPVVIAGARADFESLVQALARQNEPHAIPLSMGACIIAGYNDWSRIALLRERWASGAPALHGQQLDDAWKAEFTRIVPLKDLYQDRFILLSSGPYSGIPADALGLEPDAWIRLSLIIRLEHECAHYFTKRVFGSMRNSLLDELIADYIGIVAARGRFERDWFLRFMGVDDPTRWRPDGRLLNYRGTPPLSDGAFVVLQTLVRRAARTLERFDALVRGPLECRSPSIGEIAQSITALASAGLEHLAAPGAEASLYTAFEGMAAGCTVMS